MPIILAILLAGAAAFAYSWFIEPSFLRISRRLVAVPSDKLAAPIRLLFVSDFHFSRWNRGRNLASSLKKLLDLHEAEPFDAILLGGDYVDRDAAYAPYLRELLKGYRGFGLPMYAVLGNHDYKAFKEIGSLAAVFESEGVALLRNRYAVLESKGQAVGIIGLDDLEQSGTYQPVKRTLAPHEYARLAPDVDWLRRADALPEGMARVLLTHNPDGVLLPGRFEPDLTVAGHTHGGQFLFLRYLGRFLYPVMPPGSFCTWSGDRTVNGRRLLVGCGLEGSGIPARLLCPPEALVITLQPTPSA